MKLHRLALLALTVSGAAGVSAQIFTFTARLDSSQEVPPNGSPATGEASGRYDSQTGEIFIDSFVVRDLTTALTMSHIHRAPPGVNGPVIVDLLAGNGEWTFDENVGRYTQLQPLFIPEVDREDFVAGNTYFNVHTALYPGGEIRGQIAVVPEPATLIGLGAGLALAVSRRRRRA